MTTYNFRYSEQYHSIKLYSNDNHAQLDGGSLLYTLDDIGVIYGRSTTWPNFRKLTNTSDSINDLITTAFGTILINPSLHCYHCSDEFTHIPVDVINEKIFKE